jgi:hypothetical protein
MAAMRLKLEMLPPAGTPVSKSHDTQTQVDRQLDVHGGRIKRSTSALKGDGHGRGA